VFVAFVLVGYATPITCDECYGTAAEIRVARVALWLCALLWLAALGYLVRGWVKTSIRSRRDFAPAWYVAVTLVVFLPSAVLAAFLFSPTASSVAALAVVAGAVARLWVGSTFSYARKLIGAAACLLVAFPAGGAVADAARDRAEHSRVNRKILVENALDEFTLAQATWWGGTGHQYLAPGTPASDSYLAERGSWRRLLERYPELRVASVPTENGTTSVVDIDGSRFFVVFSGSQLVARYCTGELCSLHGGPFIPWRAPPPALENLRSGLETP